MGHTFGKKHAMTKRKSLIIQLALLVSLTTNGQNASVIAKQYWNSVVMIVTQDANRQSLALGSGLVVDNGKVVTNYHVIEGAKFAYALLDNGTKYPVDGAFETELI